MSELFCESVDGPLKDEVQSIEDQIRKAREEPHELRSVLGKVLKVFN